MYVCIMHTIHKKDAPESGRKSGQNHNCKQTSINLQKFPKCSPGIGKWKTPKPEVLELPHSMRKTIPHTGWPQCGQMNGTNSQWPRTNRYLIFAISCRVTPSRRRAACCMLHAASGVLKASCCMLHAAKYPQTLLLAKNKHELNLFAPKLSFALSARKCASDTVHKPRCWRFQTKRIILHTSVAESPRVPSMWVP